MMSEWIPHEFTEVIHAHRTGWRGALDALVSAVTGRPRFSVPAKVTIRFYAEHPVTISVFQARLCDD
jgi:hypothetical protein